MRMNGIDGLDRWSEIGARILSIQDEAQAERELASWLAGVAAWISAVAPNSGLQAAWYAEEPILLLHEPKLEKAHQRVRRRLDWLHRFPDKIRYMQSMASLTTGRLGSTSSNSSPAAVIYVDPGRITELRQLTGARFSTVKLVRLCEELNACMASESYLAAIFLLRAIKDHVPPIFDCENFDEVVSQTSGKSLRLQLDRLNSQAKYVADRFLHAQISSVEGLPKFPQVDFHSELDTLLGEIVARLR